MCHICWKQEEGGGHSYRHSYIKKYEEDKINIHKPEITYIDIKLSNECNLGCRHCDYTNTTQIHKDMVIMEKAGMTLPAQWHRSPGFEKRLEDKNRKDMLHTTPKKVVDDLKELITQTEDEYEKLIYQYATNPTKLEKIKKKLEKNIVTKPLFNTKLFTKNIETAYKIIYKNYHSNLPIKNIEIK